MSCSVTIKPGGIALSHQLKNNNSICYIYTHTNYHFHNGRYIHQLYFFQYKPYTLERTLYEPACG